MFKQILMATALLAASSTMAMAWNFGPSPKHVFPVFPKDPRRTVQAPEIDPSSAMAGLTLLAGGVAVMLGRRSKRLQAQAS